MVSCQTDVLEEDTTLNNLEDSNINTAVSVANATALCGNNVRSFPFPERLQSIQGNRCSLGEDIDENPGRLDCRAEYRGSHTQDGNWFIYTIVQGNKRAANPTAVRIERAFRTFNRTTASSDTTQIAFSGTVRVDRLPNDDSINSPRRNMPASDEFRSDFTYICQMHGTGTIRDYDDGGRNITDTESHSSAIWLLRAQRVSTNRFRFVLEYSKEPIFSGSGVNRGTITFGGDRVFGTEYKIEVNYGYIAGQNAGTITIAGRTFTLPDYDFTTDGQFFRYGAYRAGRNIGAVNEARFFNQAIIAWKNDVEFCNP